MRRLAIFFLVVLSVSSWAVELQDWRTDLVTKQGLIRTVSSVNIRHPGFLRSQVRYRANVFRLFKDAGQLAAQLGPLASNATEVRAAPIFGLSWSDGRGTSEYDLQAIEKVKIEIRTRLLKLEEAYPTLKLTSVYEDLQKVTDQRLLLEVSSLLYRENGRALNLSTSRPFSAAIENVSNLPPGELESLFSDLFKNHLGVPLKSSIYSKLADEVERDFIDKTVLAGFTKIESGTAKASQIYLEEVPKAMALLRGGIGFDCSMMSVPFYPLLDSVHVYWIRKNMNANDPPRGYLLLAEIVVGSEIVPYIITINGVTLSAQDGRTALLAAVSQYKTRRVLVHSAAATSVVNRDDMEKALFQKENRGQPIVVQMPEGWDTIDQATQYRYEPYYQSSRLAPALLVSLNENELRGISEVQRTGKFGYYSKPDVGQLKPIDRAILYSDMVDQDEPTFYPEDLEALSITEVQARLAIDLKEIGGKEIDSFKLMPREKVLSRQQFADLNTTFGLKPLDVFKYWNTQTAARQLATMSEFDRVALFDKGKLRKLLEDLRTRLVSNLEKSERVNLTDSVLLFSLPTTDDSDRFLADLVSENGRGAFYMSKIIRERLKNWPPMLNRLVANYNYQQPLWKRLLAVLAWDNSGTEKTNIYWKQFRHFVSDPDIRVRIAALNEMHYRSHRSRHFWNSLVTASDDSDPEVRKAVSHVWQSEYMKEYPPQVWRIIEKLLSDPSLEVRTNVLSGLRTQKVWPLEIWQKIPALIGDKNTTRAAFQAITAKKWPREVWSLIPSVLKREDLPSWTFEKLNDALLCQGQWTLSVVEAARAYLRLHPRKDSSAPNYDPERFSQVVEHRSRNLLKEDVLPSLTTRSCLDLLNEKRDPLFFRIIDRFLD